MHALRSPQKTQRIDDDLNRALHESKIEHNIQSMALRLHTKTLNSVLAANKMKRVPIYGDGDCFFNAALLHVDSFSDAVSLRHTLCDHMEENLHAYMSFTACDDVNKECMNFVEELRDLRQTGTWGTQANDLLLLAFANVTVRRVKIFCSRKQQPVIDVQPTLTGSDIFHPIYLAFIAVPGSEHYDGCVVQKQLLYAGQHLTGTVEQASEEEKTGVEQILLADKETPPCTPHKPEQRGNSPDTVITITPVKKRGRRKKPQPSK